jgi:diguanylate cyclase (GGDEF)-like protein
VKILCVEDDIGLANLLEQTLIKQYYQVDLADDGQKGLDLTEAIPYDLILLDWGLPKLDGIRFCQLLRSQELSHLNLNRDTPVILMTALDTITNKIRGLDAGADDYIVKPFDVKELLARIRALLRRKPGMHSPLLTWGELVLNPNNCHVTYQGQEINLKSKEYEVLELFLRNPDQIFSVSRLLDRLWTLDDPPTEGAVRAQIKGLRRKLRLAGVGDIFETTYKLGYRLRSIEIKNQDEQIQDSSAPGQDLPEIEDSENKENVCSTPEVPNLQQLWEKHRQSYSDRLKIIQETITALQRGKLTPQQQHQAEKEAHTMIGSLGSFGLDEASRLSRQIQQILKKKPPLNHNQCQKLEQLIKELEYQIAVAQTSQKTVIEKNLTGTQTINSYNLINCDLLIVEDDLPLAIQMATEAKLRGFQVQIATDIAQARQLLNIQPVDIIILDLNFPQSAENGLDFLAELRDQYQEIPVIVLTAEESLTKRVEAARLGIQCFLQKPVTPSQLLTTVIQVLEQVHQSVFRLLVVDDDPNLLELVRRLLEPSGYQVILLAQPENFWEILEHTVPDLLILDVELCPVYPSQGNRSGVKAALSGFDLCQVIRTDLRWNRLPVIFLSAHNDMETIERSFLVGADDFLSKPITAMELLNRVQTRLNQRKLWKIAENDELTGVSLRRKALQDLTRLLHLAKRQKRPLSLALIDLDHFKQVNDRYGHEMGDRVLSYLGQLLNQSFREEDVIGRWGGEEFLIAMYGTSKEAGSMRLKTFLNQLSNYQFITLEEKVFFVTFSGGIAQFPEDGEDIQSLYRAADLALYQAKMKGRNCILVTE